jgi:hypothetical protein
MSNRPERSSDLVEITKLNGEFSQNYGVVIGACLYLRSINAARQRSSSWIGLGSLLCSGILTWCGRHGCPWS